MKIYDIDGTLTKVKGDEAQPNAFDTYAYWSLISYFFAADPDALKAEAEAWDASDKGVGDAFIRSSADMLRRGVQQFKTGVGRQDVIERARDITTAFVDLDIIHFEAIAHLRRELEKGGVCVLSTGSYLDGAVGFVQALVDKALLPANALDVLIISGAIIDWDARDVTHANIAANKIKGLRDACAEKGQLVDVNAIDGIYVDDPEGNDSGICKLKPEAVRLIRTASNQHKSFAEYAHTDWSAICRES